MIICNKQVASWYIQVASRVVERLRTLPHGIFAAGGAFVPTQEKKKKTTQDLTPRHFRRWGGLSAHTRKKKKRLRTQDPRKSGKIRKVTKLHRVISLTSLPPKKRFCSYQQKTVEKQKSKFSRSALFHLKIRVCLKYFVHDCRSILRLI